MSQNKSNDKKKVGRPLGFDRKHALKAAVNVFWEKGYDGASMKDLTQAMGINSPSLYAAFGDKHQLYLQAIDNYATDEECAPLTAFENESNIENAVFAFLVTSIQYAINNEQQRGCFLGSCVATTAGRIEGATQRLQQAIEMADARLAQRFDDEISKGNLPQNFPSIERARLLFDIRQGYVLRARAQMNLTEIDGELRQRARMVVSI